MKGHNGNRHSNIYDDVLRVYIAYRSECLNLFAIYAYNNNKCFYCITMYAVAYANMLSVSPPEYIVERVIEAFKENDKAPKKKLKYNAIFFCIL